MIENPFEYFDQIASSWAYADSAIIRTWEKDPGYGHVLRIEMSTLGMHENEAILKEIDEKLWLICWDRVQKGGHYNLLINTFRWGFLSIKDLCAKEGITRQAFNKKEDQYHIISISKNKRYAKPKKS